MHDELRRLRTKEKRLFWDRFHFTAIEELFKQRLYDLFKNRCFKCHSVSQLQIDHHVPMLLGGHLVPGNLVVLCAFCNSRKNDLPPEEFYSKEELESLDPLLEKEADLFRFNFDREFWRRDRKGYLIHLGIESELVEEILNNPNHRLYIEPLESISVTISADLSAFMLNPGGTKPGEQAT